MEIENWSNMSIVVLTVMTSSLLSFTSYLFDIFILNMTSLTSYLVMQAEIFLQLWFDSSPCMHPLILHSFWKQIPFVLSIADSI